MTQFGEVQSISFYFPEWTLRKANNWLKKNNYKDIEKVRKTKLRFIYQIKSRSGFKKFYTRMAGNNIYITYGIK